MSKLLNTLCISLIILTIFFPGFVQAVNVDMNLTNTQNNTTVNSTTSNFRSY